MIKTTLLISLISLLILVSCSNKANQNQQETVASITIQEADSLIHDYTFGMTRDEFFELSWKYNSDGILINGSGAEIVEDINWLIAPAIRVFYPNFVDEKIVQFPVTYSYKGWAPWNTHLSSDSLMYHLIPIISKDYNVEFSQLSENMETPIYIAKRANSEIEIKVKSSFEVSVIFKEL